MQLWEKARRNAKPQTPGAEYVQVMQSAAAQLLKRYNKDSTHHMRPNLSINEARTYKNLIKRGFPSVKNRKHIVIVGAGLAGLSAARELTRAGQEVVILELQSRSGGRCKTIAQPYLAPGLYGEAGGMRFPQTHELIMTYIDLFGLRTAPFANMRNSVSPTHDTTHSRLLVEGESAHGGLFYMPNLLGNKPVPMAREFASEDSLVNRVRRKWEESIEKLKQSFKESDFDAWSQIVTKYKAHSLLDFLVESDWDSDLIEGISKFGLGLGGYGSILGISFIEILRLFVVDDDCENIQLVGGMEKLVRAFLTADEAPLSSKIRYGIRVTGLRRKAGSGRVVVEFQVNGTLHTSDTSATT